VTGKKKGHGKPCPYIPSLRAIMKRLGSINNNCVAIHIYLLKIATQFLATIFNF
jgi:hypothetical protein